ncbi:PilN domain-containing protein [Coriobacteriia bacterium Es71-Z0120]|uniref:PilN domain-containing protein n=1 Tax=Parvivirga hydrogeniphila TaxID=2939460 RepID=UPI002260C75E|nr:PilN domain-containing protein [Parvivirga hydrogeniphila]MCL4079148.1 PilN domain-containing protein [Parvivirga hydrogeniphila]
MIRVNLLPPEILEKRRAERRLAYMVAALIAVSLVLAGVWGFALTRANSKQRTLEAKQQELQQVTQQAASLEIFEAQQTELARRKQVAQLALDARQDWAKLFDEISLVLPSDMWLNALAAASESKLQLDGFSVDATDTPDYGHKTVAKLLVRLAELEQLADVWLTNSVKTAVEDRPALQFTVTASIVKPASTATATVGTGGR